MPHPPAALIIPPGVGRTLKLFGVQFGYKVDSAASGGDLAALEVDIPPKTLIKPHTHGREDEYSIILAGTVGGRLGDQVADAPAGTFLVKPRGVSHAMWNATDEPAKVIEVVSPGGLEGYFEELAPPHSPATTPPRPTTRSPRSTASRSWTTGLSRSRTPSG